MFHFLRKAVLIAFVAILGGLGFFLYQQRHVLSPATDYYDAWQIARENPRRESEPLAGEVTQITGEHSFQLKNAQGLLFNFQLTGFERIAPTNRLDEAATQAKAECKSRLGELILAATVRVDATFLSPQRSGLGVVYRGETNINAVLLEEGLARINRNFLKGLSRGEIYPMLRAERTAKRLKRGVWKE